MRTTRMGWVGGIAGLMLGVLVAAAGCAGADDTVTTEQEGELHNGFSFHHPRHRPDGGGANTGGTSGREAPGGMTGSTGSDAGAVADCNVCTTAEQCCGAVEGKPAPCSFSATTCSSMTGAARPAYVNTCVTYVASVRGVWAGNPPAECR